MTTEPATYPGYRFPAEIISHAIWLYHLFGLSFRDIEPILAERSIVVSHDLVARIGRLCRELGEVGGPPPR